MPVFQISKKILEFPHPKYANRHGLLAIGGDLSEERLILAYQNGIFPWNNEDEDILWWCLTPRLVLFPDKVIISSTMQRLLGKSDYKISFDTAFEKVIESCGTINRKGQRGSWIHSKVIDAFIRLHHMGIAHSVEVWNEKNLVGGLYGLQIGRMFCGESMFSAHPNMSKIALIILCQNAERLQFDLIDCQQDTKHLRSMGAQLYSKEVFFEFLEENKKHELVRGLWK